MLTELRIFPDEICIGRTIRPVPLSRLRERLRRLWKKHGNSRRKQR
ncbi:MAG TPA: hypothetical protein VMH36_05285 [Alphaproteobacteria bacterium]|nr:hypothetical protein [Alphaproteobacteria bacterium]